MDDSIGHQLSLIEAVEIYDHDRAPGDWDDLNPCDKLTPNYGWLYGGQPQTPNPRMGGNGGQPQTPNPRMGGNGGQNKNSSELPPCPPSNGSIFDRSEDDDGTWIEHKKHGEQTYRYLRWREGEIKRSKYLGKL